MKTHTQIAKRIGKDAGYVGVYLRLLELPDAIQTHIAAGYVPLDAERNLRKAAEVSPALADCACRLVAAEVIEGAIWSSASARW